MATTAVTRRTVWIPAHMRDVVGDVIGKAKSLSFAPVKLYQTTEYVHGGLSGQEYVEITAQFTSANDATFVALFPAWATRLGVALIDTDSVSATAGH